MKSMFRFIDILQSKFFVQNVGKNHHFMNYTYTTSLFIICFNNLSNWQVGITSNTTSVVAVSSHQDVSLISP